MHVMLALVARAGAQAQDASDGTTEPTNSSPVIALVAFGLAVAAVIGLLLWYHARDAGRLVRDLPTSRVKGVGVGIHEVTGRAVSTISEPSPYSSAHCVWWRLTTQARTNDERGWRDVSTRLGGPAYFEVEDDTGSIVVWPRHAEVTGRRSYEGPELQGQGERLPSWYTPLPLSNTRETRVIEEIIAHGDPVYVIGTARLPTCGLRPELGADPQSGAPFIINARGERAVISSFRAVVQLLFVGTLVVAAGAGFAFDNDRLLTVEPTPWGEMSWIGAVVGAGLVLATMALVSVVFVFNALIQLRNRARAALGLIDVEHKRRHDLVPALVDAAAAHRDHENTVHRLLAELRNAAARDIESEPSDDAVKVVDRAVAQESRLIAAVTARTEAHPTLTADRTFLELQTQLTDTEDRIALARSFYNDSVHVLRDRANAFPASLIGRLFGLVLDVEFSDVERRDVDLSDRPSSNRAAASPR